MYYLHVEGIPAGLAVQVPEIRVDPTFRVHFRAVRRGRFLAVGSTRKLHGERIPRKEEEVYRNEDERVK